MIEVKPRTDELGCHVADLAATLGLTQPRLAHALARDSELAGDPDKGLALIAQALTARNHSSDRAWADLLSLRDAIQARQEAAARIATTPPSRYRTGHSAPSDRPDRRRFQLKLPQPATTNGEDRGIDGLPRAVPPPEPKAMARKRRAARAGR